MTVCRGSFARTYGTCPSCGAQFEPSTVPGMCITVPTHEGRDADAAAPLALVETAPVVMA